MNYALFIAKQLESSSSIDTSNWTGFLEKAVNIAGEIESNLCLPEQGVFLVPLPSGEHQLAALLRLAAEYEIESRTSFFESQDDDLSQQYRPVEQRAIEQRMDALAAVYGKTHDREVLAELQSLALQLTDLKM